MNGTMPATVNNSEGSGDTSEALGTTVCPRSAKCSRKRRRISAVCISVWLAASLLGRGGRRGAPARPGWGGLLGGVRAAAERQLRLVAGGQRGVQPGAGAQLHLAVGGGGADVGTELAERVGQVAQALGDGA